MTTLTEMLDEFHRRPGVDITPPDEPTLDVDGLLARQGYLQSEVNELLAALIERDVRKYADALADIAYVRTGQTQPVDWAYTAAGCVLGGILAYATWTPLLLGRAQDARIDPEALR